MAILTDIEQMRKEGKSDEEIISILQSRGISPREISEAIVQSKVKEAVVGNIPETLAPTPATPLPQQEAYVPQTQYETSQQPIEQSPQEQYPPQPQYAPQEQYPQQYSPETYQQYAPQPQLPTDIISEIAEQIITEKLSPIKTQLEKSIDFKTTAESKIEYLDERLKRIEKIIDRLQLSVLQKVGDYLTNVEDIKKELIEMQKTFKSLSTEKPKKQLV
ncbi:MAG: hypothetical protein N3D20_01465 [Candidatus Pacearchaeota archaeon]|nr:hypothetical protein [Candidatus Pacearchaeota archaeon]